MAKQTNDNYRLLAPKPLDAKYEISIGAVSTPYTSVEQVNTAININERSPGLTVFIELDDGTRKEYWYRDGVNDENLVAKELNIVAGDNIVIDRSGNDIVIAASVSNTLYDIVVADAGDFSKTFDSGTVITSFIVDPVDSGVYTLSVGTEDGGSDIFDSYTIDGDNPPVFEYTKYFKQSTTWFFSGVPVGATVIFYYNPPVSNSTNI